MCIEEGQRKERGEKLQREGERGKERERERELKIRSCVHKVVLGADPL